MVVPMLTSCKGTKQTKGGDNSATASETSETSEDSSASAVSSGTNTASGGSSGVVSTTPYKKVDLTTKAAASGTTSAMKRVDIVDTSRLVIYPMKDPTIIETKENLKDRPPITIASIWSNEYNKNPQTCGMGNMYDAIQSVQKDYNCKIKVISIGTDFVKKLQQSAVSKKMLANIYDTEGFLSAGIQQGFFQDLRKVSTVHLDKSQWNEASIDATSYKSGIYGVCVNQRMMNRICIFYNKTLASKYGLGDLYSLVYNYSWNLTNFQKLCQAVYDRSNKKISGLGAVGTAYFADFMVQNNSPLLIAKNGKVYFNGTSNGSLQVIDWLQNLYSNNLVSSQNAPKNGVDGGGGAAVSDFETGKMEFFMTDDYMREYFATAMKDDYGLLPLPLGFNGLKNYYSVVRTVRYFSLDVGDSAYEQDGAVMSALQKRAYIPIDQWDHACAKVLRDSQSIQMLHLIMQSKPKFVAQFRDEFGNLPYKAYENVFGALDDVYAQKKSGKQAMSGVAASVQKDVDAIYNS